MNDNQKNYIAWFIITLLVFSYNFLVSSGNFFRLNKQVNIEVLLNSIKILNDNQIRLEREISGFKKDLPVEIKDIKYKNLAKALLLVAQINNKLLKDTKFTDFHNYINEIKLLMLEFNIKEVEYILENIEEIDTLNAIQLLFEQTVDKVYYNKYSVFKKITSNWIKIRHKNDPLRMKWLEIEECVNTRNWLGVSDIIKDFTDPEFKLLVSKLRNLIIVLENISIVHNILLQYIS
jgi:hypothetical protein